MKSRIDIVLEDVLTFLRKLENWHYWCLYYENDFKDLLFVKGWCTL